MDSKYIVSLKKHISTHTERSAEDRSAVSYLESVLNPEGRINTSFGCDDKWPNHDGMFEYVSNPDISRLPEQNFIVQIKGTHNYTENNSVISYNLKSLAFPAYIAYEVTAEPGIMFIVLDPDIRGKDVFFGSICLLHLLSLLILNNRVRRLNCSLKMKLRTRMRALICSVKN